MSVTYRAATVADIPAVVTMARHFIDSTRYRASIPSSQDHLERTAAMVLEKGTILLAIQDGEPVGMIAGVVYPHFLTTIQTLGETWWWVEPAARGADVADGLLARFEAWGRVQGATRAELGSRHAALDRFYRRRGYAPVERIHAKEL